MPPFLFYGTREWRGEGRTPLGAGKQLPNHGDGFFSRKRRRSEDFFPFDVRESHARELCREPLAKDFRVVGWKGSDGVENSPVEGAFPLVFTQQRLESVCNRSLRGSRAQQAEDKFFEMKVGSHWPAEITPLPGRSTLQAALRGRACLHRRTTRWPRLQPGTSSGRTLQAAAR